MKKEMNQNPKCNKNLHIPDNSDFIDLKRLGSKIRSARKNQGLTQEKLAELIDVTPAFVGHIERGERSLSLSTLLKITQTLHISMDSLFSSPDLSAPEQTVDAFRQLIQGCTPSVQSAVIELVRVFLKHFPKQ